MIYRPLHVEWGASSIHLRAPRRRSRRAGCHRALVSRSRVHLAWLPRRHRRCRAVRRSGSLRVADPRAGHAPRAPGRGRSARVRPRPAPRRIQQVVETATVVGPPGEEVHTDAFGRIKVQFHWDRDGQRDDRSSCWIRHAELWAGRGFGTQFIPRVGMEVVVSFLGGDVDRPIVTGCVANAVNRAPFQLPEAKTAGAWSRSSSNGNSGGPSPGGVTNGGARSAPRKNAMSCGRSGSASPAVDGSASRRAAPTSAASSSGESTSTRSIITRTTSSGAGSMVSGIEASVHASGAR
ncbi:type VI secretion system tip protein TssI/VgrG [Sorangium sp. So ce134]